MYSWSHGRRVPEQCVPTLGIRNQREILRFLIPILNVRIEIFFALISTLIANVNETAQKKENLFYDCVLEFY